MKPLLGTRQSRRAPIDRIVFLLYFCINKSGLGVLRRARHEEGQGMIGLRIHKRARRGPLAAERKTLADIEAGVRDTTWIDVALKCMGCHTPAR